MPDRGPNATAFAGGDVIDNTASFIARVETARSRADAGDRAPLPFVLSPALKATTLLYSGDAAHLRQHGQGCPAPCPAANSDGKSYFTGRSDNFGAGLSTNPDFARFDPEAIRVSNDGNTVFIADEYGPYVYQFDRATGRRIRSYPLPDTSRSTI